MTDNKVILAVNNGDGKTRLLTADAGRTVKVKLIPGNKYLLKNINDDFAPENITLQRVDKALHIIQEGDTQPSIIIEDYFNGDPNNPVLMGMAEDGLLYAYVPLSGESYDTGYLIADGSMSPVALGGEPLGAGGPLLTAPDDDNDMLFGMLGWFALAAAGVGAAFALSEMDKDDGDNHSTPDKPSIGTTMDDEGSIKGPLKSGDTTDDSTPTLTGKGKPGDTIHIYDNDKEIGSVIVDDEGEWSYTPDKPLGEGEHELTVVEKDPDGNASPPSDPIVIVVDTVAPKAPTIEHIMDKVGKTTGEIHDDAYTDDPQPEMSGTGEAGATIAIYDNGKKIGETTVNDDGRWYFKPSENLTDGSHSITVSQTDKAGNVSEPSDERDFIVLTEPPGKAETPEVIDNTGPVTGPLKPGDVTDDSQPSFSGEGTPGNTIIIKDNDKEIGSVIVDDEGKWSFTPKDELAEGEHNVVVVEEDPLGNEGDPSDPIQIIVDTTPPAKPDMADALDNTGPITGQLKGGDVTDETRPVFSGKGEPGDTVTIYDGDEVLGTTVIDDKGNWTLKPEKPLGEGHHSITVTQTDKAGNTSDPSEALEFEVDTTAPDASANVLNITAVADDVGDRQGNVASGDITDDSKPLISGIGEAGNTVFVYTTDSSGKHLIGTAVVGSDGTWSLTPETPLTEGLNKLTLETQDPAGNRVAGEAPSYDINLLIPVSTAPSINSVVDNAEPHVGPLQKGESTNDTTPTLSGSAAPGDIVSILDNGKVIGTVKADSNGKWAFSPDTALADGKHTFTVTATDAAGNARTSGSFPIVIDTAAPSPAENIVINDNVGDKQGPVGPGDTTDDQSPTLSGEAEPGSVVDIYDNDEKIGSVIVDDEGKWSYTPDTPLAKGDHEITTTVTDPSGNTSEPSPGISFTVDPDPNQVTVGEIVDDQGPIVGNLKPGTVTDDVRPELSGKGKPGSTVTIMDGDDVLGSTVVDPDGNWTFTPEQDLADGDHSLTVISKDPAGNEVTSPSFDITVDATAPEKPVLGSATDDVGTIRGDLSNGGTTDDANPTFNGSAEPGSRVDIYDNGEHIGSTIADDNGAWQFTPTTPLPEGEHHITTTATDEAGNTGPESDDFVLVTDYTPPVASSDVLNITSVMDDVGGRQGNVASGEITDDSKPVINGIGEAGSTVFVYSTDANGKHLLGSAVVNSEGTWRLALDTPLVEGLNQLTLETQDAVGNRVVGEAPSYDITVLIPVSTEPSINSVVDNAEPHVGPMQKGETTNDTTPTLSGSAAPGDVVSILDNGKVIGTVKADSSGKWSFTPDTALADGQHTFTVTATDAAGNARTSGTFPIVIDTAAPSPAENIVINDNVGDKQGPVGPGDTTDDQSPTLSGEAEPGSVVDIYDNDEKIGSVIVDDEGKWSYTPDKPLAKGDHEITTTVTDPSGNTSEPSPGISFTVDPDPNQVTVGEVVDDQGPIVGNLKPGTVTDDARPELSGKGKPGSTVTIMDGDDVLGSTVVDPDGNWTFTPEQDLADGDHSLTVISKDPAGNDVTSPSFDISVDTVAPEKPVIGVATDDVGSSRGDLSSGSTTDDANPTFKGSAEPGSRVDIYDNGELIGSTMVDENGGWQFTPTTALPEGEHHITTTATDEAGNTGPESDDFVLITDYTAPDASKVAITEVYDDVNTAGVIASGEETDDNRPLIKGTGAEPGNTITVYNGDKVIGTAKVQADGTWSLEPTTPLPDGKYTLTAKETDGVGNVSGPSGEYIINVATVPPQAPTLDTVYDDVAPHADYLQKGDVTNDTTPTLSGSSGVAGGTISIYDNGRLIGTTSVGSNGSWSFTPDTALADGSHNFTATVTDGVGRTSEPTGGFGIVIDTKAPEAASDLLVTDNVGAYQGPVVSGDTTDDNTPTLSGKAEPGSTVNIIDNGQVIGTAKVNPDGTWSYTPDQPLANGAHDLTTTVTDPSGNTGPEGSHVVITVDVVPGKVEITAVTDDTGSVTGSLSQGALTDDTRPQISGTAKAGSTVTIMDGSNVLGTTTAGADGTWSFTPSVDLGRGDHTFTATAKDPMGNESSSSSWTVTIDTDAPVKPTIDAALDDVGSVQGNLANGGTTDDPTPTLSGKAEAGSTVKIYDQNGLLGEVTAKADGTWSFSPVAKLPEGEHRFHVTATDKAGNTSVASDDFVLTLDYTAPDASKLAITEVYDDVNTAGVIASGEETDDNRPLIKGTGAEPGNTITVYNGDKVIGTAKVQADGTWSLEPTTPLPDGKYTLTAKETDGVGNVSGPSGEYIINVATIPPQAPTLDTVYDDVAPHADYLQKGDVTNDTTPTLSGSSGVAGGTISIYDNGRLIGTTSVGSNGSWSFTPDTALADGSHNFTATVTDGVGRTSEPTGGFGIVIDTKAPEAASDLLVTDNVGAYQGPVVSGDTTDDNTPTLSGKAEPGSTVNIIDNGQVIGTAKVNPDGTWSYTPDQPLANGAHDLTTTVTDPSGNTGPEGSHVVITVDVVPGKVEITAVTDDTGSVTGSLSQGALTDDTRPQISGTAKAGSTVTIMDGSNVLGTTTAGADGTWSFTPSVDLGRGDHTFTATAKDPMGNESSSSSWTVTIDTDAPVKPTIDAALDDVGSVQGNLANGGTTDDPTPTLSGKAEAGSTVKIYDQNGLLGEVTAKADGTWSFSPVAKLPEGEHRFHVTATDKAGNTSVASDDFVLTLDYTAPDASKLAITEVYDDVNTAGVIASGEETDDNRPLIKGTGAEPGNTITVYNGDKVIGTAKVQADGTWSLEPTTPLPDGKYTLTAKETDGVGNVSGPSGEYIINVATVPPQAPTLDTVYDDVAPHADYLQKGDVTNDTTPTLSGSSGVAGGTISIYDNGRLIGTTSVGSNGSWSFTPDTALADGSHNFTATVTDGVGRTSEPTGGFGIVIDTKAPDAASDLLVTDNVGAYQGPVVSGDTTDDNTPTLSGKAEPGSTVNIIDNGQVIGTAKVNPDGTWSYTPDQPLANGAHDLTTTVTDPSGNTGPEGSHVVITVDVVPGKVEITAVTDDTGSVTGSLSQGALTDDTRPQISGTAKAGSTVTIMDGSNVLGTTTVGADGTWSFTPSVDLGRGDHTFTATAKDPMGNESSSSSWTVTIDTDAPVKPTIDAALDDVGSVQGNLANGGTTDDPTPTLSGKAEAGSTVKIYDQNGLLGEVTAKADGTWSFSPVAKLPEGEHRFHVTATDRAGNTSVASDDFVLTLDYTAPDASKLAITEVYDDVNTAGVIASGEETDDNRPLIKGTGAEAGNTITVYNGDKVIGTAKVQADGTWSLEPTTPLPDGKYTLTAKETDGVGNVSGPSGEYIINVATVPPQAPTLDTVYDDVAPHADYLQKGDVTNDTTPTLSGSSGVAGGTISIYDNGRLIGTTSVAGNGSWSFTPDTALADGSHNFTATVTDGVGRTSEPTGGFGIVIDTKAPDAASDLLVTDNVGAYQGPVVSGDTTDDNTPTLSGKAEPGSTVNIIDNGQVIGTAKVNPDGTWSYTPDQPLANGAHDLTTTVTDPSGNTGPEGSHVVITVDVVPGKVEITAVTDDTGSVTGSLSQGALTDDTRPQISGTAKAGSTVTIMDGSNVLGTTTAGADGTWSFTPSVDLGRGDHTFTATAKDPMGNESASSSWTVTIDTDAPVKPTIDAALDDVGSVQGNLANGGTTDDPTPTLSGKAEAGSTVKIYDQNGLLGEVTAKADGTWSFSPVAKLPEGEHRFHVTATDRAGNTSVASDDFVLTLDYTAPDVSKVSITDVVDDFGSVTGSIASGGKTDDNTPLIKGTGAEPGNTITVYNGDKVIGTAKVQADGTWELQVTKALPDGTYTLTVKETDSVGNTTAASPEYIIQIDAGGQPLPPTLSSVEDDVAPHTGPLQKDATTNDNTLLLTGTAEAGVTVRIYGGPNGTTLLGETKADAQGKWSFNTPKLADGVHTFVAEAINDIGQVSPQTGGFPITVDTSAPGEVTGFIVSDNEGPQTGTLSNGDTTDDATPTISGKAEPGSVVHIYVNGQENGTAVADANGNWTYTTGSLADGEYTFTARAEDSAGNLGAENAGVTVTLDTSSVPVTIVRVMDDKGSVTGELKANDVTDDARPEIIGKAKAGSTVTIMDGNVVLGSVKADASGNWVFTPTSDLGDGVHNITATAKDLTGKEDTSSTFSFEIDSKAPNRPSIDYAEDQVGTIKDDLNSNDVTDDPQPILHGTAEAGSTVNIYTVDGTLLGSVTANSNGAWNFKPGSKLPEGKNTFYVTATDEAGNVSDKSADFILTTDYTAPDASKVAITEVIDNYGSVTGKVESGGVLDDSRPVIKGTGAEIGNVITVYTTDASGATKVLGTTKVDANGTWTLTVSDALYADLNKLTVTETDTTGNTAKPSTSYDVTLSSAPGVPVIDGITDDAGSANVELSNGGLTKDTTPTLHGTASGVAGNTVTIYNGSQVVGTTTLDANGHWSFTPGTALADGSYHFTVTVTNTAGQESEKSQVYSIDVDATAPNPATDILIADDVSPITGNLQDGDVTDDNKPTFSGKAEAGSTVNILDGGKVIGSTTVDSTGNWDWTPGTALADGDHAFTTTVTDKAGNTSAPTGVVNITVDTQGSTVALSIDGYHDDVGTNTGLILGSGTSTDDTSPILQGSWSGDLETTESIRVYQDGILLGLAVLDRANHTWTMAVNGLVNANTYKFTVVAVDAAGNESAPSAEFALTIDQDAPTQTVSITSYTDDVGLVTGNMPGNTSTDDRQPVLNGKVTGTPLEAGDEVRIYDVSSNTMLGTATVNSDGTWSFELPPLDDNMTHTFRAVVADNVGNEGTPSSDFAITVDLNLLVNKQDTLDTTPIVSGSTGFEIQQGEYVEVTVNGKTYSSQNGQVVVDMRNNTWYVQIPDADALNVGTYDVKAVLFDAAGVQIAADESSNELVVSPTPKVSVGAGGGDPDQKATSVTLSEDGVWRIHSNQTMLDSTATSSSSLGDFSTTRLQSNSGTGYSSNNYVQNATFIDYNRDGMMDLFTVDSNYDDGQQMFYYNGSTYTAYQVGAFERAPQTGEFAGDANTDGSANTWSWYGGIVAIDKNGDGYVDMINGDQTPNDSAIRGGYGSQIVLNNDGTVVGMSKDGTFATDYAADSGYDPIGLDQSQPDMELSGVDINNDGIVDFVMHSQNIVADGSRIDANGATDSSAARSTNQARLVVVNGTNNGNWKVTQIVDNVFQRGSDSDPGIGNGVAMTWGDYNGDGYLDLFLGRGSESTTSDSSAGNNAGEYASRIHFNDGNGKLLSDDGDNNGIGNPTGMYTFNDTLAGGASLALDWNHDGKMDVIELPGMESSSGGINDAAATGPINLYTNTSVNGNTSFTTSNLLTQVGKSTIGGSSTAQQVTGAIAIDVDWDGDRDLLAFTSGGTTTYIENKNEVAHGTSIHLRILDEGGINTLFGNTVQLIDEATGQVVSTQIINAQSGNQTNDSTAIVDFYNLDATKSYSAVILRSTGGAVSNVGGVATVDGKAVQNVNKAWGGLTAAEGNHAYVLTTESENNVANASASGGTNTTGIVGTGYNDTFFATLGNDLYNGAGGTETVSGVKSWNNTGGLDIVDYKLAGSTPLNIDLNKTGMQNTGFGSAQFVNVEGLAGGSGNDTFTGNAANNYFEGRAGADTFYLDNDGKGGGQDTLKYQVQENGRTNGTGGNGSDVVHGFVVGTVEATRKADIIDISSLLVGYAGDADGAAHYINGVATIDAGDAIAQYLSVTYNGKDTILSIDRDGSGSGFGASQVLTIADTKVDLETLLANHQLVIKGPDVSTMNYSALNEGVTVNMWTGFTSAGGKLEDIVKIVGTQTDDTITDNSFSNVIAGEGGNDTFYLMNGGNDVLMYNVLEGMENDATGGNGHDTVHGFKVGNVEKDGDADTLNLSDLVDYSGPVTFFENNGKMELDAESKGLEDYLKVDVVGNDTVISVDIDGQGGQHGFTQVVTLADVQTDLVTLLQNNQIMM
ncbi:Ig-like domain-containing protein [Enterobacter cloacae]|uniref:Ig-like domain-containing protein n=64 Tax=Enterobacter TaxID=547 RepID=UPI001D023E5F|nr:Ig-like domain-containing protein [Enterobacter cloacae]UDG01711.1 Ig-like domain-containing protein [Enterobacter cloacae]